MSRTGWVGKTGAGLAVTAILAGVGTLANAADVTITSGPATSPTPSHETVTINATLVPVLFPPVAPPTLKRDATRNALLAAGFPVTDNGPGGDACTVHSLALSTSASLATETTGTPQEKLLGSAVGSGEVAFVGHFSPTGYGGQPAIFTAGIVTDLGIATEQVSAQELNFQTDGPIICQALFQRLAPRAPQYGAQINYAGDRLEVYFDPAYTVTQGGIIFGTTSPSPGCLGTLELPLVERRATLTVEGSTNTGASGTTLTIPPINYFTSIAPLTPANPKRDAIAATLSSQGRPVTTGPQSGTLTIHALSTSDSVTFRTGATGEAEDGLAGAGSNAGKVDFTGHFDPLDYGLQPATFTAGIVTDLGIATEQVSAQELNFQTDGPIICQALFQRLAPRAPQYGAQINYAGDRLEVYFDPAYTVTHGGIIFGTTSPSPGCSGTLLFAPCGGLNDCSGNGTCVGPNQCECFPGWTGADCSIPADSPAGSVPASLPGVPLTLGKTGGEVTLQWGASCLGTDTDYEVYEGSVGTYYSHQRRLCSTGGAPLATLTPLAGNRYFLVVPRNASREGSYGRDSGGVERPQGSPLCLPMLTGKCP